MLSKKPSFSLCILICSELNKENIEYYVDNT